MTWIHRDRTPVLFTVLTSVTSGLIVATIVSVFRSGIPEGTRILWFVLIFGAVVVITFVAVLAFFRARKRPGAFVLTSAFSQKYFLTALVQRLHGALDRNGIDLVLKVPDRDYDASAMSQHLTRMQRRQRDYVGGIIIPGEVNRLRNDLTMFCRESRLPVVFTDIEPFENESDYPENSAFVGYDTGGLGELAGRWLVDHLRGRDRPHILIVASREHPARQERCEQVLRTGLGNAVITTDDRCEFTRSRAYEAVRAHVRRLDNGPQLDAIFCTNDEMALGAVDALRQSSAAPATVVVGIDGVLEVTSLIDAGDSPLRATVVQDSHRLAVCAVDVLEKMQRGRDVPKRTFLPAEIYECSRR